MAAQRVVLKDKKIAAAETLSVYFEKPQGFRYKAGQSIDLTLLHPPETDEEGNTRAFTLASAPFEHELMITTRLRNSAFKRTLKTMPLGSEVNIDGPFGNMTLHSDEKRPAVFLAGGIGITPFRSIILQALHEKKPHRFFLFFSNRQPRDAAFFDELKTTAAAHNNFVLIAATTGNDVQKSDAGGERERIGVAMIHRHVGDLSNAVYYCAGPAAMVAAMRAMLSDNGVNDDDIRSEEFSGY
ncbi:MAG: FAD-dependent oxidoreductase [Bacteroidota bacterium]|nr:FAD-dependent oxidoreductase [Bacteroidota bacterium]